MSPSDKEDSRPGIRSYISSKKDTATPHKRPRLENRRKLQVHNFEDVFTPTSVNCTPSTKQLNPRPNGTIPPPPSTRKPSITPIVRPPPPAKPPTADTSCQTDPMDQREIEKLKAEKEELAQSLAAAQKDAVQQTDQLKLSNARFEKANEDKRKAVIRYHDLKDAKAKRCKELEAERDAARKAVVAQDEEMERWKAGEKDRTAEEVRVAVEAIRAEFVVERNDKDATFAALSAAMLDEWQKKLEASENASSKLQEDAKKIQKALKRQRNEFRDQVAAAESKIAGLDEKYNALKKDDETLRSRIDTLLAEIAERDRKLEQAVQERDDAVHRSEGREKANLDLENRLQKAEEENNRWRMWVATCPVPLTARPLQLPSSSALSPRLTPDGDPADRSHNQLYAIHLCKCVFGYFFCV
ncbi:hypothetical protein M3Y99_00034600 [Aphelenchoides fujianensis]|nr:hypothetical protein M3Y99_00034600 [Aphelenchoides fujianensis]